MLNSNDINCSVSAACLYKMCDDRRVKCYKCIFVILELVLIVKFPALVPGQRVRNFKLKSGHSESQLSRERDER